MREWVLRVNHRIVSSRAQSCRVCSPVKEEEGWNGGEGRRGRGRCGGGRGGRRTKLEKRHSAVCVDWCSMPCVR